jgi:hypothetical protein
MRTLSEIARVIVSLAARTADGREWPRARCAAMAAE